MVLHTDLSNCDPRLCPTYGKVLVSRVYMYIYIERSYAHVLHRSCTVSVALSGCVCECVSC